MDFGLDCGVVDLFADCPVCVKKSVFKDFLDQLPPILRDGQRMEGSWNGD